MTDAAPETAADPRWRGPAADRLRSDTLDGLTLVFDRQAGLTHVLAPPLPELLEVLAHGAATAADLRSRLADRFDLDGPDDPLALITERMDELVALGLAEAL